MSEMTVTELIAIANALRPQTTTQAAPQPDAPMPSAYIGHVCMVRCDRSGVFYGTLVEKRGRECRIENARRVWYWSGAASLSELAQRGTSKPAGCKFPAPVASVELTDVIEVIPMTAQAVKSLNGVPVWTE